MLTHFLPILYIAGPLLLLLGVVFWGFFYLEGGGEVGPPPASAPEPNPPERITPPPDPFRSPPPVAQPADLRWVIADSKETLAVIEYANGGNVLEICQRYGMNRFKLYREIKKRKVPLRPARFDAAKSHRSRDQAIVEGYQRGDSLYKLSVCFNLSESAITNVVRRSGVKMRRGK